MLPYQQGITNTICKLLTKYNIRTIHIPGRKNTCMLRPAKDDLSLRVPGTYQIMCDCGKVYTGQTGKSSIRTSMRHIHLEQAEKSVVGEHNINTWHHTDFSSTSMMHKAAKYMDRLIKEATELHKF
jgi:hypothetical protein